MGGECNWSDVPAKLPTVPECKRVVQNWTSSAPRAFAGMPRESDIGFEERLTRAHQDICEKVGVIVLDPKSPSALTIFGAFNVLATGFADNLVIDDKPFAADAGPKHILAGFTALVAGRYRQEREMEEGKVGMEEIAKLESRYGRDGPRPTPREISMATDHKEQLEQKRPRNPTSCDVFAEGRWKTFSKIRDSLIEKVSGKKGGHLNDSDPRIWYKQIEVLEMEIEGLGWDLQGPEICRALWDLLPLDWRVVLKETKAYKALLKEDFKDTEAQVITSRYTGLVTAIYENFGNQGMHVYGTSITTTYRQRELESTYAFAERIRSSFSKDMGPRWETWPDAMRAAFARKFVEGLCEEDHKVGLVPTAERVIERSNWEDFTAKLLKADEEIGPRARVGRLRTNQWPASRMAAAPTASTQSRETQRTPIRAPTKSAATDASVRGTSSVTALTSPPRRIPPAQQPSAGSRAHQPDQPNAPAFHR